MIEARKVHCLFKPKIIGNNQGFSKKLRNKFKTVCFTETPLDQINRLTGNIPDRNINLKPYGLVFSRGLLLSKGANPAVYINSDDTYLTEFLLDQFDDYFDPISKYRDLERQEDYHDEIIQYYSLINKIGYDYDYSWEREWRYQGSNFRFKYGNVIAVIAADPDSFLERCEDELSEIQLGFVKRTPIISPYWNYEDIIEALSKSIWRMMPKEA